MSNHELYAGALRDELVHLWSDLAQLARVDRRVSAPACWPDERWPIACGGIWERIAMLTHLVGPVDRDLVQPALHHLLDQVPPPDPINLEAFVERGSVFS